MSTEKSCPVCGDKIIGRKDKKFCSDQCRNVYNNEKSSTSENYNYVRKVNRALKQNRNILAQLNPEGKRKVHRNMLIERNFNFDYVTRVYTTQKGSTYMFCYDYGYLPLENDFYLLIKWEEKKEKAG